MYVRTASPEVTSSMSGCGDTNQDEDKKKSRRLLLQDFNYEPAVKPLVTF